MTKEEKETAIEEERKALRRLLQEKEVTPAPLPLHADNPRKESTSDQMEQQQPDQIDGVVQQMNNLFSFLSAKGEHQAAGVIASSLSVIGSLRTKLTATEKSTQTQIELARQEARRQAVEEMRDKLLDDDSDDDGDY